jgi:hypothetical protein
VGGSTNSNAAALTVNTVPSITQQPSAQTVTLRDTAHLTIAATGDTGLSYQWQKGGTDLDEAGRCSGTHTATLTVSGCTANDSGSYLCVITGGCGSVNSSAAALTVTGPVAPDLDVDGDVDIADFALFVSCQAPPKTTPTPDCANRDFNHDGYVDQSDFGIFQRCMSGPVAAPDANCAN